jgi:hypothetical protein
MLRNILNEKDFLLHTFSHHIRIQSSLNHIKIFELCSKILGTNMMIYILRTHILGFGKSKNNEV